MTANLNDPEVQQALERFRALCWIERNTTTRTTKAKNELLRSLPPAVLAVVAVELKKLMTETETNDPATPAKN